MITLLLISVAAAVDAAPATPPAPETEQVAPAPEKFADPELFQRGTERLRAGMAPDAASLLHAFLEGAPETDARYAPAQLQLGKALVASGLRHAGATWFARVALDRTDPKSVPEAVDQLIALTDGPHDDALIEGKVFASLDVAFLPKESAAAIHFTQGLRYLRNGEHDWSRRHFAELPKETPEAVKAQLAQALHQLERSDEQRPKVIERLAELADAPDLEQPVRNEVLLALARLRYEAGDYLAALEAYQRIELPKLDPGRATLYLEEAWTRYRLGQFSESLGMLVALDAPSFRNEFLPEKHLLRAFIYRDTCHFISAKRAVQTLPRQFASTLETIDTRGELDRDRRLVEAALSAGEARDRDAFLRALEKERARVAALKDRLGEPLARHLGELYDAAIGEARRRHAQALDEALQARAGQLLEATEKARLLEYEIGLALNGRAGARDGAIRPQTRTALSPDETVFRFRGEYWNDELRTHRVLLENRCANGGA